MTPLPDDQILVRARYRAQGHGIINRQSWLRSHTGHARYEAQRIGAAVAKLPELLRKS
jgi:hypothetical protein